MNNSPKRNLSWLGAAAIGLGGANLTLYTLSSLVSTQGTIVIPIFLLALILTYMTSLGYIELVLMYPNKIGGIAIACTEAFHHYSPILTTIIGVGYWLAWLMAASFGAIYAATIIQSFFPWISVNGFSTFLIVCVTLLHLSGLSWVQRFAIPIAAIAAFLALMTVLIPVFSGNIVWNTGYSLIAPFPNTFGSITSFMAALYLIGWLVPGYECTLCYVGEMKDPQKNVKKAMFASMFLAALFYGIAPSVWLSVIGPENISKDLAVVLGPAYTPLLGQFAKAGIAWFLIFNMLICLFAPLGGPPRTIAQLAKDGLIPEFLGWTSKIGVPSIAIVITSAIAILIVWVGAPTWLIAATNFQYLLCIALASIAVWLLRRIAPSAPRLYRAPDSFIYLGLFAAAIWMIATILGFRQYGLSTMVIGISFSFIGVPLYFWRKITDRISKGIKITALSLHIKLTGTLVVVLIFDAIGYLVAIHSIGSTNTEYIAVIEDIFIAVALLTLTAGLIIPGMIVHTAEEVNNAAKRIIKTNLTELSMAMESLGSGNLNIRDLCADVIPLSISSHDEIGEMAKSFNLMQEEIKKTSLSLNDVRKRLRTAIDELTHLNLTLEARVVDRTEQLESSNVQLKKEILERSKAQEKASTLHEELMIAARRAGMADIATSTLHNIGNTLNNVNISANMLYSKVIQSQMADLEKVVDLFNTHQHELKVFLTEDPNGKLIPKYLSILSDTWKKEQAYFIEEINGLRKNIEQINNIISMQQSLSGSIGVIEIFSMENLIKDAMTINKSAIEKEDIEINYDFEPIEKVSLDRVKLLQIIVNLVKNSVDSLIEKNQKDKKIMILLKKLDENFFKFQITDTGAGIEAINLEKIFTSGFTTKKSGYGFGLHSSSLAANDMNGSLSVESEGAGKGATFILILPFDSTFVEKTYISDTTDQGQV
jgi:signal transduction histidine kinase